MSEEKPVLKVTDRRLFNPDGTPRDVVREDQTATTTANAAAMPSNTSATTTAPPNSSQQTNSASSATAPSSRAADSSRAVVGDTSMPPPRSTRKDSAGAADQQTKQTSAAEDPTAFVNLLMFIASPAAAALGLTEHPGMGAEEIDLPLAKHCIDLLGTLRQKTHGNVTAQEDEIFENLLAELRMQFVSLSGGRSAASSGAGGGGGSSGFSGSDITGGR